MAYLIAEIGINHNGDVKIAENLIKEAKSAGFDAVKFQKRSVELVYDKELLDSPRESPWGSTQREQKEALEFGLDEYRAIDEICRKEKIAWSASAWDLESLAFLDEFNLPFHKIASPMLADLHFCEEVAQRKKYTYISTGMSNFDLIDAVVSVFEEKDCPFELMHCVSEYPLDPKSVNLNVMSVLRDRYKCRVGYSGHESGTVISIAAFVLGATSIERHITLDRTMYGSDQAASIEPAGMKALVDGIAKVSDAMGDGVKIISEGELKNAEKLRAHIKRASNS